MNRKTAENNINEMNITWNGGEAKFTRGLQPVYLIKEKI